MSNFKERMTKIVSTGTVLIVAAAIVGWYIVAQYGWPGSSFRGVVEHGVVVQYADDVLFLAMVSGDNPEKIYIDPQVKLTRAAQQGAFWNSSLTDFSKPPQLSELVPGMQVDVTLGHTDATSTRVAVAIVMKGIYVPIKPVQI